MNDEHWEEVENYPSYAVSNYGEVVNIKFGRPLKPRPNAQGYLRVTLSERGVGKQFYVHQLVAQHFLDGWFPGMHIGHDDEDRYNNAVSNLVMRNGRIAEEYIPQRRGRPPRGRKVRIIETGEVFLSARDCARYIGGDYSSIYSAIREPWRTHRGYHYEFYEEND